MLRILLPENSRAPKCYGMKEKEHRVQPVLKRTTLFVMDEFILRDKKTREDTKSEIDILIRGTPGEIQNKEERGDHSERIHRMTESLPGG